MEPLTFSAKFHDNLLVQPDKFHHFLGLIVCNYQELKVTVHEVLYALPFLKFMELLSPFTLQKIVAYYNGLHCHFCCFLTKTFHIQISPCFKVFNLNNLIRPFIIYNFIFMDGYYNSSIVVRRQCFDNYI